VVCAAATDRAGNPAGYSQFPLRLDGGVALRAPGGGRTGGCGSEEDVWTTALPGSSRECGGATAGYGTDSGTTFAVAHTAGVAALLAGERLTNVQILECLRATSSNRGRYDPVMGYGMVDAAAAVSGCSTAGRRNGGR
jgi:subtilisin family serine protease